jgi:hypothetical protein
MMIKQISPILLATQNKLTSMGYAGAGPISSKGLSAFIGRYLDKKSGRIKTVGKPNYIYNRNNWEANYQNSILMVAYKWNQFVASVQRSVRLL